MKCVVCPSCICPGTATLAEQLAEKMGNSHRKDQKTANWLHLRGPVWDEIGKFKTSAQQRTEWTDDKVTECYEVLGEPWGRGTLDQGRRVLPCSTMKSSVKYLSLLFIIIVSLATSDEELNILLQLSNQNSCFFLPNVSSFFNDSRIDVL